TSLAAHGFHRDDVTDVLLTHLHFDHCGGSILREGDRLLPAFKNAVYWSNEAHWNWATKPNDREKASFLKENILPIQESGQLQFISQPSVKGRAEGESAPGPLLHTTFSDNISLLFADGHTRGMMLPQISYKGRTIVYMADLLPSAGHIPLPYVMAYDMFPLTTLQEKGSFLNWAEAKDCVLFFEHDAQTECCDLQRTDKGVREKNRFSLKDLL
ncbi:MAG TPA: MBL fold metallo-hydrolase, partial [Flavisolibacter sp.]|nr:MBL fold metallo-hydrolase [Flavisolibacter sp.]